MQNLAVYRTRVSRRCIIRAWLKQRWHLYPGPAPRINVLYPAIASYS
jgi:hypothetical protein